MIPEANRTSFAAAEKPSDEGDARGSPNFLFIVENQSKMDKITTDTPFKGLRWITLCSEIKPFTGKALNRIKDFPSYGFQNQGCFVRKVDFWGFWLT